MIRPVLTELVLFATPFVLYALFIWATKNGGVLERSNWPLTHVFWLSMAALVLVIGSFVILAQWGGAPPHSTYTPARFEDGKLIPGETR
ncbi:MAG: hypothetical protein IT536_01360 [Hyphomicrobiales bacterium]|nr:hypothetical protein [Hyphomicrobiales bacterium]